MDSYIKMRASEVEKLCQKRLAQFERDFTLRVQRFAKKYRARILVRLLKLLFGYDVPDRLAAERWAASQFLWLYDYGQTACEALLETAQSDRNAEMYLSVEDYEMLRRK